MLSNLDLRRIGENLTRMGSRRMAILSAIGIAVLTAVIVAAMYLGRPMMQPIYTGLSTQDVGRITSALAEAGISFDVNEQRSAVLVALGAASRARAYLASKGLPASSRAGYELFDQMGSMGFTSFMQEVTRVRALEGEIARSIQAIDGVTAARVHLVIPEAKSFRRERTDPSASVVLRLDDRWQMAAAQSVRHLVAAAVPGMKPDQVNVASTDGRLLATGGDLPGLASHKHAEIEKAMATDIEQRASRTLSSALGPGNFQISATIRLDLDRQQINETVFDPKSRVERSTRVVKQSGSSENTGTRSGATVEANIPKEDSGASDGERRRQRDDRREELTNYELNSKTIATVKEGYRVSRLTIAVLVNRKQLGADDAAATTRVAELRRLVIAATGANVDREDRVELSAIEFGATGEALQPVSSLGIGHYVMVNIGSIVNAAALLGVVALILMFGLKPLLNSLSMAPPSGPTLDLGSPPHTGQIGGFQQSGNAALGGPSDHSGGGVDQMDTAAAPASPQRLIRERLEKVVQANDEAVVKALKGWIKEA